MILYLLLCSLLVPANAWAAITPHLHSDISMRILHGLSTAVLVPLLAALWKERHLLKLPPTLILAVFSFMMLLVNSWITVMGMGVEFGWLDHLMLVAAHTSVLLFFLLQPDQQPKTTSVESHT